jgi:3-methylfumaryl-CoA hydratase
MSDDKPFAEWIGQSTESEDIVTDRLVASFEATFAPNLAPVGAGEAPIGIHWCLSPSIAAMEALGPDGHPAKNLHLPPVPQPRRMWAGGAIESLGPIMKGDWVHRVSTISDINRKQGRSGELWFVTVNHSYHTPRGLAVRERHDIVYREAARPGKSPSPSSDPQPAPGEVALEWRLDTTPTLLFRYSALTFNGHRIHYDLPYATEVEGYEGLVVHGPIQATLLYNLAAVRHGGAPRHFEYRGMAPAICGRPLRLCAGADESEGALWTEGETTGVHMRARASVVER